MFQCNNPAPCSVAVVCELFVPVRSTMNPGYVDPCYPDIVRCVDVECEHVPRPCAVGAVIACKCRVVVVGHGHGLNTALE